MTKKRPITLTEDEHGEYYKVPIASSEDFAFVDREDLERLHKLYGYKSFFRANATGQINIRWKSRNRSVARLLLKANDLRYVVYADGNRANLRRRNISLKKHEDSAANAGFRIKADAIRSPKYVDPYQSGLFDSELSAADVASVIGKDTDKDKGLSPKQKWAIINDLIDRYYLAKDKGYRILLDIKIHKAAKELLDTDLRVNKQLKRDMFKRNREIYNDKKAKEAA